MKTKSLLTFAALTLGIGMLSGCGSKDEAPTTQSGGPAGQAAAFKPSGDLEVAVFQGGFGLDFFEKAASEYGAKNPDVKIKVWGNPRVWEQLRPRFVAGSPPDLSWPGWGMDYWALVYDEQLMPLDSALDSMAADGKTKWRDTFEPGTLKLGEYEGKTYMLPYHINMNGWWYDPGTFAKNGWTPPKTWSELLALGEKIKAKGMAPLTYQGKYPYYMVTGFLFPWAISAGGVQAINDASNLVPGAWKSPAFLKSAQMIKELVDKGFFEKGAIGLSHTESQTDFLNGKAAMIPCGTWLYSEMSKSMPAGAKIEFFLPPVLDEDKGDPTNISIGIEAWVVPSKAKNPHTAVDFYKYMTSVDKAKQFVEEKGTLMAIKGSDAAKIPDHLKAAAGALKATKTVWNMEWAKWYPKLDKSVQNAMTALLTGEATPEQFCDRCEAAAEVARQDKELKKHKVD